MIDGKVGFTGGVNIGDEYINRRSPFGHWKDTAIMLEGDGVEGLTQMFLQMWNVTEKCEDFGKYLQKENCGIQDDSGFILPLGTVLLTGSSLGKRFIWTSSTERRTMYIL